MASKRWQSDDERKQIKQYRTAHIKKYLQKKKQRTFLKKIVYGTRKRVADRRIRFKGRFINEIQAR